MTKGQEVCFACGQHVRERAHPRGERPHNRLILVLTGVLVLAAIVGIVIMVAGRGRRASSAAYREKQAQIEEAARAAVQAKRDSARAAVRDDATGMLVQEVNDLESRFNLVRGQVVKAQPSPAQAKIISQITAEVAGLRQLTTTIAALPDSASDSLKQQLRDDERVVRSLISDLSRAPKK